MRAKRRAGTEAVLWRIGEVAKLTGVTTRTLRYWEELGVLHPTTYQSGGRLYSPTDVARVSRILNLQELLGFSLAEVRAVLDTEEVDVLDRVRAELKDDGLSRSRRRVLLDEAIVANDQLLARLDDTLFRIHAFRDERAAIATRLLEAHRQLDDAAPPLRTPVAGGSGRLST
jgi:DNA-binding transcriptional MerR regulator